MKSGPIRWLGIAWLLTAGAAGAQVLTEWVESRLPQETDKIALGYPLPLPVDTPLPFDGFRSYAGLHARHQDLAATTPWVHLEQIGLTRGGATIWAYRLGDEDLLTTEGLPEPATLTNGGIHAREWQTPEVVTGILELLATHPDDRHLYAYLRDNVNMIVIPSLNIDGFLQTQRYPAHNYLFTDPDYPDSSPRDGRMRRKNMLGADEVLSTTIDHLGGVDLNRNNDPFWASNPERSSDDARSLVYHGAAPSSEPETRALEAAAALGPAGRLRLYTDVHSFSLEHFWVRSSNARLAVQTERVLEVFSEHHAAFPAGKRYAFAPRFAVARNAGIGSTDEYFTHTHQVPSWTLEVEPSNGQPYHAPLPGGGADYGGAGENGHDGFILPESEIGRVREQLAKSFAAVYYRQAGPPAISGLRILDSESGAVVYENSWDPQDSQARARHTRQWRPLQLGRSYTLWLSFNKPMRWRDNGVVAPFPGQSLSTLGVDVEFLVGGEALETVQEGAAWLDSPGGAPGGYARYRDDAVSIALGLPDNERNRGLVAGEVAASLEVRAADMTGMYTDGDPGTVADWRDGAWVNYEDSAGAQSDSGGFDATVSFALTDQEVPPPFLLEPGITSSWYDPAHDGEGFQIQMLANDVAVMYWFTYDTEGGQDWYVASGEVRANRIVFAELYRVSGGEFGPGFDPAKITREVVGSASFTWSGCDEGDMSYRIGQRFGRLQLARITRLAGLECGQGQTDGGRRDGLPTGSWYDPAHDGEGYIVEMLADGRAVTFWFSFDPEGRRRWFYGLGEKRGGKLVFDNLLTTRGGRFGPEFDPDLVEQSPWGSLQLELDCDHGRATYSSTEAGFGSGSLNLVRLTRIDTLDCPD